MLIQRFIYFMMISWGVILPAANLVAQTETPQFLLTRERSANLSIHTRGFGLGYQQGRIMSIYRTLFWQVEFATMRHPKEYKRTNESFPNPRTYNFGKLNRVYMIRGGLGMQRTLADRPYQGGVVVKYHFAGGLNISIAEPVYLWIIYYDVNIMDYYKVLEKYDPDLHFSDNIHGRGPVGKGLLESKIYPGGYLKGGFFFDYGQESEYVRALEVGAALDAFPKKIPIMAFAENSNFYLTLYLSLHIGNRK